MWGGGILGHQAPPPAHCSGLEPNSKVGFFVLHGGSIFIYIAVTPPFLYIALSETPGQTGQTGQTGQPKSHTSRDLSLFIAAPVHVELELTGATEAQASAELWVL